MSAESAMRSGRILSGLGSLCLMMLLTGCAASPPAPPVVILPVKCEHPVISPYDGAGLTQAITLYWRALESCNALNGHGGTPDPALQELPTQK